MKFVVGLIVISIFVFVIGGCKNAEVEKLRRENLQLQQQNEALLKKARVIDEIAMMDIGKVDYSANHLETVKNIFVGLVEKIKNSEENFTMDTFGRAWWKDEKNHIIIDSTPPIQIVTWTFLDTKTYVSFYIYPPEDYTDVVFGSMTSTEIFRGNADWRIDLPTGGQKLTQLIMRFIR